MRTSNYEDYANYKEALNAATTEIRQSKRSYEQKLACNLKSYSNIFLIYMSGLKTKRTRQGRTSRRQCWKYNITGDFNGEDLNGYFSSVFTREDISSLPVSDATFQEAKSYYLGALIVTPEMVGKKIKAMKDNQSPGVDVTEIP